MSIRAHFETPCWQVNDAATGQPFESFYECGWPHNKTRERAEEQLAEDVARLAETFEPGDLVEAPRFVVEQAFPTPCVGLFCDGPDCKSADEAADLNDEGWTHLDPSDPMPFDFADLDWLEVDGKHYCPNCVPPWCDDCDRQHHDACPDADARHWRPIPVTDDQLALGVPW